MSASRYHGFRFRGQRHGLSARRGTEHGGNACDGAWPDHARRRRYLSSRRFVVSGDGRRFHLDGAVVPAMVRGHRQGAGEISYLQRFSSPSTSGFRTMNLEIDRDRMLSEIEMLASFSDAEAPAVTRIVFSSADLKARAWLKS